MTPIEAAQRRKMWREEKRRIRRNKQDESRPVPINMQDDISSPVILNISDKNGKNDDKINNLKLKLKMALKKCANITKQNEKLKIKYELYKKRYYRVQERSLLTISKMEVTIDKMKAREEILENTLKKTYNCCQNNNEKRILKSLVLKSSNKAYVSKLMGLKFTARVAKKRERDNEILEITSFYIRDDVSRSTAGKKECRVKHKEKQQIRYLLDSLHNLYTKYKEEGGKYHFTTFYKQKPFFVLSPHINSRDTCLCIRHSNINFQYDALKRQGIIKQTLKELLQQLVCNINRYECVYSTCNACKNRTLQFLQDKDVLQQYINWYHWERQEHAYKKKGGQEVITKKTVKAKKTDTIQNFLSNFSQDLTTFKKHYFNMNHQSKEYQKLVSSLQENEALIVCDFSENYDTKMNTEIQSMHFGASKSQISLHTLMVYWKASAQSFCTISDNTTHQPASIWAHLAPVLDMIKEKSPDVDVIHFYSDGPSSQYKQKQNFFLLSHFSSQYGFRYSTWSFFEAGHGKSVADAIGGSIKRTLDTKVCHGVDITNASDAYSVLRKCNTKVEVRIIDDDKINEISALIPNKLSVLQGTMKLHQIITCNDNEIKYRDISCFCEPLRGNCSCYVPKFHFLRDNNNKPKNKKCIVNVNLKLNEPIKNKTIDSNKDEDSRSLKNAEHLSNAAGTALDEELLTLKELNIFEEYYEHNDLPADDTDIDLLPIMILPEPSTSKLQYKYEISQPKISEKNMTKVSKAMRFLECNNCNCSILSKKTKCMSCNHYFCQECAGNQYLCRDFLCDACLQADDE